MLVYEKAFHLPVELEHKAYWILKFLNFNEKVAGRKSLLNQKEEGVCKFQVGMSRSIKKEPKGTMTRICEKRISGRRKKFGVQLSTRVVS